MKIELTEEENVYLHHMVRSSTSFYEPYVKIFAVLQKLTMKVEPPRTYISLNSEERQNLQGLIKQAIGVIGKQKEEVAEGASKEHVTKVESLLNSIDAKLTGLILPESSIL